jgi:TolB protein
VAYAAYPDEQGANGPGYEIYVSPTDGSGAAIAVSNNPEDDVWPVWSPDGTRIAFVSAPGHLRVVNADGTGQIDLTPAENAYEPAWSPDGTRIAYSGSVGHVFVANADGSGRTELTPNMDSSRPTWTGR